MGLYLMLESVMYYCLPGSQSLVDILPHLGFSVTPEHRAQWMRVVEARHKRDSHKNSALGKRKRKQYKLHAQKLTSSLILLSTGGLHNRSQTQFSELRNEEAYNANAVLYKDKRPPISIERIAKQIRTHRTRSCMCPYPVVMINNSYTLFLVTKEHLGAIGTPDFSERAIYTHLLHLFSSHRIQLP